MAMSRRDYERIADVIASVSDYHMSSECREILTMRMAYMLSSVRDDDKFDYGKFYVRCGVDS